MDQGLKQSEHCLYAYYHTKIRSTLQSDILAKKISILELQNFIDIVPQRIRWICKESDHGVRCVFDISRIDDFQMIVEIKRQILQMQDAGFPIFALFALDIDSMTGCEVSEMVQGIPNITLATANETIVSLQSDSFDPPHIDLVDRSIVEDLVKKLLEPFILSCLNRPVSGYDIIREINEQFHVIVPMARIYSYLYDLERRNYLKTRTEGRSKVYEATPAGEEYIRRRRQDIFAVLGYLFENR
ncbi:PadR family transcriptional regulator [Methanoculleus sp. YWC-01]|uniref:PadR family transcriptional regulator n=1 Tax=Methanoculleus nereidis TaxID=2735141 RepID=A0ABU3Z2Z6_9EURY|nr:PadR family transcriptional regulator [Methanoculleus sp. YWC-01]MDV4343191.1 PadR family transcriptional regulator [Methanoculleus sp. YWC-01]